LSGEASVVLDRLLRFAVHDLGALGIGALFVFGGRPNTGVEPRLATPPPLRIDRATDLGPLRHVLAQIDGAAVLDGDGVLRQLGVRLVPSRAAEDAVAPTGGTRRISAQRYSFDDPDAIVVVVSEDGPVTVFRSGRVIGRSAPD
jgi:DNA integrity scanning protein DisA with diadenylate cyclase activity